MNKYYAKLNIDTSDALVNEKEFVASLKGKHTITMYKGENLFTVLKKSWVEYLASLGYEVTGCLVFSKTPYSVGITHIDLMKDSEDICVFACNFVIDSSNSKMVWYDFPIGSGTKSTTEAGTPYVTWLASGTKPIESVHVGRELTLVNVGVPHNIICDSGNRVSFSVRIKSNVNTWEDAVKLFNNHIV